MSTRRVLDAVRSVAGLDGPVPAVPVAGPGPEPSGVPTALVKPVGDLLGAIDEAGSLARGAVTSSGLNREAMWAGALLVAGAIDKAVPALRAYAASLPASHAVVAGCDIVNDLPRLCIGGKGQNTYTRDAALVIDLGGRNTHEDSAGAADPGTPFAPGGNGLASSVTIDMGTHNVYRTSLPTASGARIAQGAGFGGIGFLVNYGDHARYELDSSSPESMGALGQGWSILGVGVLADLGGHATYVLDGRPPGTSPMGPGGTSGDGVAGDGLALLDEAGRDNSYLADSVPVPAPSSGTLHIGEPNVVAFGAGFGIGAGVFYDGGGHTSVTASARTQTIPAAYPGAVTGGDALVYGFGYGSARPDLGGYGMALSGPGDITYKARSEVVAPDTGFAGAYAFGHGSGGGTGVMSAAGGHDRFLIDARSSAVNTWRPPGGVVSATAGQVAVGGFGNAGKVGLSPNVGPNNTVQTGGLGLFQDLSGRHHYSMIALSSARADAGAAGAQAQAVTAGATAEGQGYGTRAFERTDSNPGAGFSFSAGDADYTAITSSTATALGGPPAQRSASAGPAATYAQGFGNGGGYGELRDDGGTHHYAAVSSAFNNVGGGAIAAPAHTWAQASVDVGGYAVLEDRGSARDLFTEIPAVPACEGTRGMGVWRDCGTMLGIGIRSG